MNPNAPPFRPMFNYEQPMQQPEYSLQNNYHQPNRHEHVYQESFQQQQPHYSMGPPSMGMSQPTSMPPISSTVTEPSGQNSMLSADLLHRMYTHSNGAALFEVQIGLEQLVYESHEYETWANAIRDRLTSPDIQNDDLSLAADIIIEMAVYVNSCQYNFSRLCQFLDNFIRSFAMSCLVPQLNEFAFNHHDYDFLSVAHRQNFLLFLAELYDKIEVNGIRLAQIAALVFEQANYLLKSDAQDATVKAVIQMMKLVGRHLEADQGATPIDGIFSLLDSICYTSKDLSENLRGQILALHQLRENKWGISNVVEQFSSQTNVPSSSSSVFVIGPDGKPLSEEEYAFLEESCAPFGGSNSPSESYVEALEDDDVLEDYEKFLQATAIRAAEKALEKLSVDEDDIESIISNASGDATRMMAQNKTKNGGILTIVRKEKRAGSTNSAASSSQKSFSGVTNNNEDEMKNNEKKYEAVPQK